MQPNFNYLRELIGTPYVWWKPGDETEDVDCPFWTRQGPLPAKSIVKESGCNCAGFLNLACRTLDLPPIGGTPQWWDAYAAEREPYDPSRTYPTGTLFFRPYSAPDDQGHLALMTPWGLMHSVPDHGVVLEETSPDLSWCISVVTPRFAFEDILQYKRVRMAFPVDATKTEVFCARRSLQLADGEVFTCPQMPRPIVITGRSDHSITDNLVNTYGKGVRLWFTTNKQTHRVRGFPIGVADQTSLECLWKHMNRPKQTTNLVYMNFVTSNYPYERKHVWDLFSDKPWVTSETNVPPDRFFEQIRNHRFVLCPRGNGVDTHRLWETLYLGAIPIVKRDIAHSDWMDLPILFVDEWSEVTPEWLETVDMEGRSLQWAKLPHWIRYLTSVRARLGSP